MADPRVRALILAAGLGTRLRPLTLTVPKPLLPVCGEPAVAHTLYGLRHAGCEAATLNLHHLADAIPHQLGRACHGLPLYYSREEPIQGTLGALYPVRDFLAEADVVVLVNSDALARWPWRRLIRAHLRSGAQATLLLHRHARTADFGGGVGVGGDGRVVELRPGQTAETVARRWVFTGAHLLAPDLLDRVEEGPGHIVTGFYEPLLREGAHVQAVVGGHLWHDMGTPARYLEAVLDWARGPWPRPLWRGVWVSPLARIAVDAVVERSVVEAEARVETDARVVRSLVLPGATVGAGCRVRSSIVGPGVELPPAVRIDRRMVTTAVPGYAPGEHESVLGNLIYTPLD